MKLLRAAGPLRTPLVVTLGVGALLAVWVLTLALQNVLFFARTEREPYNTSSLRMAAKEVVSSLVKPYYDARLLATSPYPIYDLELSDRRLAEWHAILRRVQERGRAAPEDQYYIPATFRAGDLETNVDIRGRGTLAGHYKVQKPSFRVKFPKDRFYRGNRVINLIIPYEQAKVMIDTTINAVARQEGLVTYPRRFVVVRLNGRVLGLYQEVEHFREELAVKQLRSEGFFISGLAEEKGGAEDVTHPGFRAAAAALEQCVESCSAAQLEALLDTFFDREKTAFYTALTTWFGATHAWGPDNLILFFDPARGRFEPVPWDLGTHPLGEERRGPVVSDPAADLADETPTGVPLSDPAATFEVAIDLGARFLERPAFRRRRNELLWELVTRKPEFVAAEAARQFAEIEPVLAYDVEFSRARTRRIYERFQRNVAHNTAFLRDLLARNALRVTVARDGVRLANEAVAGAAVAAVTVRGAAGEAVRLPVDATVDGRYRDQLAGWLVAAEIPFTPAAVEVEARNALTGEPLAAAEVAWEAAAEPLAVAPLIAPAAAGAPAAASAPGVAGVTVDADGTWRFAGDVLLTETLVAPQGVPAVFAPGLHLRLAGGVNLILRGDLTSLGTPEAPISIDAADPAQPFGSLAVFGRSDDPVVVRVAYTTLARGSEADFQGIHTTGAFSIYTGSLEMTSSQILDIAGEDGLNVKYGFVTIRDSLFARTASDALDLDFCSAVLTGNEVRDTLGDGFDFSGSLIEVRDNRFVGCADKGMSVGEHTTVLAAGNVVASGTTGIAVKDLSVAEVAGNDFSQLQAGIAVYRKKQVFGSGFLSYEAGERDGLVTDFMLDPGATVLWEPAASSRSLPRGEGR